MNLQPEVVAATFGNVATRRRSPQAEVDQQCSVGRDRGRSVCHPRLRTRRRRPAVLHGRLVVRRRGRPDRLQREPEYVIRKNESQLVKPAPAGAETVYVTNTTQMTVGQSLVIGSGDEQETATILAIGRRRSRRRRSRRSRRATNVEVTTTANFPVGAELLIGTGAPSSPSPSRRWAGPRARRRWLRTPPPERPTSRSHGHRPSGRRRPRRGRRECHGHERRDRRCRGHRLDVTALAANHAAASPVVFHGSGLLFTPAVTAAFDAGTTLRNPRTGRDGQPLTKAHATDSAVTSSPGNVVGDNAGTSAPGRLAPEPRHAGHRRGDLHHAGERAPGRHPVPRGDAARRQARCPSRTWASTRSSRTTARRSTTAGSSPATRS